MTDQRYEIMFKDLDCCQNCIHFCLGMHFDGCGEVGVIAEKGWE